ncbi:uncharacterized protein [Diadema antillarum]|uniref:uncharacterized protein n=1 Tax=Diadema antillarum TaxID=105358 RepID=UPI003A8AB445
MSACATTTTKTMTSPEEDPTSLEEGNTVAAESENINSSVWTTGGEKQQDTTNMTPEIFSVDGEMGTYHGDSHIAMRMSAVCKGGLQNVDKTHPHIWALLPKGYDYHICAIEIPDPCHPEHYKIGIRLRIDTEQAMNEWIEEYQRESFTGWRIGHGNRKSKAVRILYQKHFKCKHNIFFRKSQATKRQIEHSLTWRGSQHTGCPAKMNVAIRVHVKGISKRRASRARDVHMPDYPAMVSISHTHNHETQSEYALRFRSVDKEVESFYIDLFKAGHSALTAHSFVTWKRWAEYGADFEKMILDRAYTPDIGFVYRLFYRMLRERKPHMLKPLKVKKTQNGVVSNGPVLASVDTTTPPHVDTSSSSPATINDRLGTDVIMEEDEGEVSPVKKPRLDSDGERAVSEEVNSDSARPNSSMLPVDESPAVTDSEMPNESSQLDNSAVLSEMTNGGEEEETHRDFFAHGRKKRIPGNNKKRESTVNLKELYEDLEKLVSKHVMETHPAQAHLARITGDRDDMIIAICTPLMRRAHAESTMSGEVCILDGTFQSFGQGMCYVISFMVPSSAGGVPLGFLVLSSMDQVFITQGLELFKMLIPEEAFGGRGRDGPTYFLTDEEHFKGDIVQATFPNSIVHISPYHLILMAWRWLVDPKRRMEPGDMSAKLNLIRELVGCQSAEEIHTVHLKILGSEINDKHREFAPYVIDAIVNRWSEWSLPADHPIHRIGVGVQPWEKVMNCLRDRVLMKGRHFNILQMTHFLLYGVDAVYEKNLVSGCQNVPSNVSFTPVFFDTTIPRDGIKQLSDTDFLVNPKSKTKSALGLLSVNTTLGVCSCVSGKMGYFCAHMAAVFKYYNLPSNCKLPFHCGQEKYQIYKVATGEKIIHEQLTETMQQLSQVVEANLSSLTDPIRHFIQQIQRADSTANLGKALQNFTVLTKQEKEEEERAREERERLEREKEEEEERRRREEEEEEEKRKAEELRQREAEAEQQRKEEERRTREAEMEEQLRLTNNKDGRKDVSWLLSQDTVLVVTAPQASNPKHDTVRHKGVLPGRTERKPIMTPGRAVTRGVSRMLTNIESNKKKEASSKRKAKQSSSDSPAPKSTVLQEASRQMKQLAASNAKEKNLVLLVSEKGGMLLKGSVATMADLGRVLVINRPITDQQVGFLMPKDSAGVKKGVPKKGKKGKS